ncbi:MAG: hypothetical protein MR302_07225, partial [Lachnospiraceae bacterium]|nr:hypothetical protein [Lachnospiraceae bacterium]
GLLEERKPHKISILNAIRLIKEKMALGYKSQSRFVYSLRPKQDSFGLLLCVVYFVRCEISI